MSLDFFKFPKINEFDKEFEKTRRRIELTHKLILAAMVFLFLSFAAMSSYIFLAQPKRWPAPMIIYLD